MSQIRRTPAYWKKIESELLAMEKQLGCPTFFLTLSCADLRWDDLVEIIAKLKNMNFSGEQISSLDSFQGCKILNSNPVTVLRQFQNQVEVSFQEIILISSGLLSNEKYYAIRVEFQVRGC